jgi:hypothetical protein
VNYDGPERRNTDLRDDIAALAEQVGSLDSTIRTTFVPRSELQDGYPDFEVMYARMDVLEERMKHERRRGLQQTIAVFLVLLLGFGWYSINQSVESCQRGNRTRAVLRDIGTADEAMWRGVRDDLFPAGNPRSEPLRVLVDARLAQLELAHSRIQGDVECGVLPNFP